MTFLKEFSLSEEGRRLSALQQNHPEINAYQATMQASTEGQVHADYWKQKLSGGLPGFELLPNLPYLVTPSSHGKILIDEFSKDITHWIHEFAKSKSLKPSEIFLAIFQLLLHKYTSQEDIIVGLVVSELGNKKNAKGIDNLANIVPIRILFDDQHKLGKFLFDFKDVVNEAINHSNYPLTLILKDMGFNPEEKNPIFNVSYTYTNVTDWSEILSLQQALDIEEIAGVSLNAGSDFGMEVIEYQSSFGIRLKYNSDLYADEIIARLYDHFCVLLSEIGKNPDLPLVQYPIITEHEKNHVLQKFNNTKCDYPTDKCMHQLFVEQVLAQPDNLAVRYKDERLNYQQLYDKCLELALYLQSMGVKPDSLVGLCMERSVELMLGIQGIMLAGGAYVPLDPDYPDDRLSYMVENSDAEIVLTQERFRSKLASLVAPGTHIIALDQEWSKISSCATELKNKNVVLRQDVKPDNIAYVIYTSGSTGRPKGVMVPHQGLVNRIWWMQKMYWLTSKDIVLQKTPYSFDVSVWEFVWPMMTGASVVFAIPGGHKDVQYLENLINQTGVTTMHFVPSMLNTFLENAKTNCKSVRQVFCSGEALGKKSVDNYRTAFPNSMLHNLYGPTEASIDVTSFDCSDLKYSFVPIGIPIDNIQIHILDPFNNQLPIRVPGELHIAGDGLAKGYVKRPDLTKEKFVPNPFNPGTLMYKSGDLACWMEDGNIAYLGRIDTQVKIRGFRIEIGEIEARLNQHPKIKNSCVIVKGKDSDKQLIAFYISNDSTADGIVKLPIEDLRAHLLQALPEYMLPAAFVSLESFPLMSNGKLNRRVLQDIEISFESSKEFVAPSNELELQLAKIWSQVLNVESTKIGVNDNFFELGGQSLSATQLISRVQNQLAVNLQVKDLFDLPSIAQLAQFINKSEKSTVDPILPISRINLDKLPLSYVQERLWIIDQLEPNNVAYNLPIAKIIKGKIEVKQIEKTLNLIIDRHETLRTVFPSKDGRARLQVLEKLEIKLEVIDLSSNKNLKARNGKAKKICQDEAVVPFDLANGPLIRAKVIRLAPQEHILMLNLHHIISDGWSEGILINEFGTIFEALRNNQPIDLQALPIQYIDYSFWQRERLKQNGILEPQLAYWQKKLEGMQGTINLATDYPRPNIQSFTGASKTFNIDASLILKLKNLADQQNSTFFMTLLAVFKTLLYRYTSQEDICVGTPIANRQQWETENLIGMFVNTLALRDFVKGDDVFTKVLEDVKVTCLEAYAHQETPFEKVVELVQPQRNLSMSPLFQIMFVLQNTPVELIEKQILPFPLDRATSMFDLMVDLAETKDGISGTIEYSNVLFKEQTIDRLINNFVTLCEAVTVNPNAKIKDLNYLSDSEKQQLLVDFNNTQITYSKGKCIHHLFAEQVKQNPNEVAVVFENEQLTYQQLYDKSNNLALYLQSLGIKPDGLVGVCLDRSIDMIVGIMGVLQAGGAYIPLDPNYPDDRIAFMLDDSKASVVLTQENLKERLNNLLTHKTELVALDKQWSQIESVVSGLKTKKVKLVQNVTPDNLAYVIYTSGSTGKPKGVAIEHHSTVVLLDWATGVFDRKELVGVLASTSICFDLSIYEIFLPLSVGGKIILVPNALVLPKFAHRDSITLINTVPSVMEELVRLDNAIPNQVLTINLAGEPLSSILVDKIYECSNVKKVYDLYGPTEDTTYSTFTLRVKNGPQTIGRPISNTQAYILDQFNNPLPIGIPGELHLAGDGLARCYLNRPDLTKEKFVQNPFIEGARMYKTGDLVRWMEEGTIEYMGRIDRQVKIRGFRIEIGEVETQLSKFPEIKECVVVAQGKDAGKHLVAFYVSKNTKPGQIDNLPLEDIKIHLKQVLPDYMLPSVFVSLEEIPLTQNGKINRRLLETMETEKETQQEYLAPRDDFENQLVEIWAQVLNLKPETIGVNDHFFEIGGNSINAVSLAAIIEKTTSCKFLPVSLFKYSTIQSISKYIQENTENSQRKIVFKQEEFIVSEIQKNLEKEHPEVGYPEYYKDSLAIVGISCHFPDAEDIWRFWKNLKEGKESVHFLSKAEALEHGVPLEILNNPNYVPLVSWLEGKEYFDPEFFKISSGNAAMMDPQFRLLLLHAWKAVEDAGYICEEIEKTSVFISASNNFYQALAEKLASESHVMENSEEYISWLYAQGGTIPTMISYQLGLKGPSFFVHSNCSSALTGLYSAYQSLQSKDIDCALIGASTLSAISNYGYIYQPGMNFSSDGHCKTFDAKADGMVDGEGVGVILVKRAIDAIEAGDHIYCLLRGVSINNDGSDKVGYYAPSVNGQSSVIRQTLEKTKINPETISYVEAHGTGTAMGDPIELMALSEAYQSYTKKKQFCGIGSVKSNIGHLDTAAGLAGLIKIALSLSQKKLPPTINYVNPNPQIDFVNSPFYVLNREMSWAEDQLPKRAALSSFGLGGANSHAIFEEYRGSSYSISQPVTENGKQYLIPLSAKKETILKDYANKLLGFLNNHQDQQINISELAYTFQTGRKAMEHRAVFVVQNINELVVEINAFIENKKSDNYFKGNISVDKRSIELIGEDEDYKELISHWIAKQKYKKLAQLWVNGTSINWNLLYTENKPSRMSLPSYPFAKEKIWIDIPKAGSRKSNSSSTFTGAVLHPMLHRNTSDLSRQKYTTVFNGEEFFLRDHKISGHKVLPAVAYIEMVRAAVEQAVPVRPEFSMLELQNMVWVQPILVTDYKEINIALWADDQGQIDYEVYCNGEESEVVHCQGSAVFSDKLSLNGLDVNQLSGQMQKGTLDVANVYQNFKELGTDFGPAHQGLYSIHLGEKQLLAQLALPSVVDHDFAEYTLHPSILDSALQACNVLIDNVMQPNAKSSLPFSLESLNIISDCPKNVIVWARFSQNIKPEDKLVKLDVDLCDREGNICVQLKGFSFRILSSGIGSIIKQDKKVGTLFATPEWQLSASPIADKNEQGSSAAIQQHVILCDIPNVGAKQLESLILNSQCTQLNPNSKNIAERYTEVALSCFEMIKTLFKNKLKDKLLIQLVVSNKIEQSFFAGLSGLLKTATIENPSIIGQVILVDAEMSINQLSQLLLNDKLRLEDTLVKYEGSTRNILKWKILESEESLPKVAFKDRGIYLITGGLGGLGTLFTKEILQQTTNARIILADRSELTDQITAKINDFSINGNIVEYKQLDISNSENVNAIVDSILKKYDQLNGILHTAGMVSDSFILKKTPEEFRNVLLPKVTGTMVLDDATKDVELDFLVLFSSESALGSTGQADYASANAFMDHFANYRNQLVSEGKRYGKTLAVNWPFWQEGGMRVDAALQKMQQETTGMIPMPTQVGMQALYRCLESQYNQVLVKVGNISMIYQKFFAGLGVQVPNFEVEEYHELNAIVQKTEPVVAPKIEPVIAPKPEPAVTSKVAEPVSKNYDDLLEKTQDLLIKQFSELFKVPSHQLDPKAALETYGIDSILAISATNQLEKTFGTISKTLLFEYQTIHELAEYFAEAFKEKLMSLFAVSASTTQQKVVDQKQEVKPEIKQEIKPEIKSETKSVQFSARRFYHRDTVDVSANAVKAHPDTNKIEEDAIAIIGISGRYPEALNIEEYWNNLRDGKDCIIEVPKERWDWRDYYTTDRTKDGVHYSKWGGFIKGVDEFDPKFFNISPKEAEILDPQERLFLQHAWMAIEDAGYTRATLQIPHGRNLPGQVGVYVGVMYSEYQLFGAEISQQGKRMAFGNSQADVANRVSFVLNVHGPSLTIDTMCSSSLTTIDIACQDLKHGRTDMAVAGGVNVSVHPNKYLVLSSGQYISTTGHCHSFGVGGDGYIPGEGVGAVILKRLSDAEKSGDHIYGVIRGSALNHGGKTNGYTVPNPQAQSALISHVISESKINPRHISYIEAHGTGTVLGDPIEIAALTKAFYQNTPDSSSQNNDRGFCLIGSVKSNIGHCESAAGVAAVTKILLQMKHQQIVPSLHSKVLNPNIDFDSTPFIVNQTLKPWEQPVIDGKKLPRIAGVSSFGAGGANAHLIIEEYQQEVEPFEENTRVIIPLSARTLDQLKQKVLDLINFISKEQKPINLSSMAYTLQVGREPMEERLGFIVSSVEQLLEKLQAFIKAQQTGGNILIEDVYQGQVKRNKESMLVISQDDDMRETIGKWIARRKIEKLLDLWVKGLDLDWQKLYGDVKPKRMSLPAYPFAREKYWWNDTLEDGKLTLKQLIDRKVSTMLIHPILHLNTSNLGQQSYSTIFTGEENFLKDYQSAGQKVLPTVAYLEMARVAVENALPEKLDSGIIEFYDTAFGLPVIIGKNKQVKVSLIAHDVEHIDFEIHSEEGDEEIVHCQGHAVINQQPELLRFDIAKIKAQLDKNQLLSEVKVSEIIGDELSRYILHPSLLDNALQIALNLLPSGNKFGSFPYNMESVHIISSCKEKMIVWVRYSSGVNSQDQEIKLDIDLFDDAGDSCVQLRGVTFAQESSSPFEHGFDQISSSSPRKISFLSKSNQALESISVSDNTTNFIQNSINKPIGIVLDVPSTPSFEGRIIPTQKSHVTLTDSYSLLADSSVQSDLVSLYDYSSGIYSIQINNASLTKELIGQLLQALNAVKQIESVKVLMIRGGESDFLLGDREQYNDALEQKLYQAVISFPYPIISVMAGNAGGAGFLLGSLCDFMICSEQASYFYTNLQTGLYPTAAADKLLKERFGIVHAYDFMYLSTISTGVELKGKGWNFPILPKDQIEMYLQKLTLNLVKKPQKSLRLLKQHLSRHLMGLVNNLTSIDSALLINDGKISSKDKDVLTTSYKNVKLEAHEQSVLIIGINPTEKNYSINDCLKDLTNIFEQFKQSSQYKSIVIKIENSELIQSSEKQISVKEISDFSNLILKSEIPVVAVLDSNSKGLAWLLCLFCDSCIYDQASYYSTTELMQDPELARVAAMIFAHRFGLSIGREMLLSGLNYSGFELQQKIKALQVTDKKQTLPVALKIAEFWAKLPTSFLSSWKQFSEASIQEKMNNLPVLVEKEEEFKPVTEASTPVLLNSKVIRATADPDGILVVRMEDKEAKNMFSDALTQGIIEVFEHIRQSSAYKVVIMTGFDNYFASGGTKEDLLAIQGGKAKFTDTKFYHFAMECKIPVIAAMQGHAIGAGWSYGMYADFILFSEESKYLSPYMNFGFTPGAGASFILPERLGYDLARETFFIAQEISGSELRDRGIQIPVISRQQVFLAAIVLAKQIVKNSRGQLISIKNQLTQHLHSKIEENYQLELSMHDETFVGQTETLEQIQKYFTQVGSDVTQSVHSVSNVVSSNKQSQPVSADTAQSKIVVGEDSQLGLIGNLKKFLSQELHMQEHEIDEDMQFIDLGLDSITGVTWVRKINEKYNLSIEATRVYSYPTLNQFSRFIQEEISKKGTKEVDKLSTVNN